MALRLSSCDGSGDASKRRATAMDVIVRRLLPSSAEVQHPVCTMGCIPGGTGEARRGDGITSARVSTAHPPAIPPELTLGLQLPK